MVRLLFDLAKKLTHKKQNQTGSVQTELVEKTASLIDKVKENEMPKQKPKRTGREKWKKGKSRYRSALEEKKLSICTVQHSWVRICSITRKKGQ